MKLYIVTLTREAMVWAESESHAERFAREIEDCEEPDVDVTEAHGARASGWDGRTLVYCDGTQGITLDQAEEMQAAQPQQDTHTKDLFAQDDGEGNA